MQDFRWQKERSNCEIEKDSDWAGGSVIREFRIRNLLGCIVNNVENENLRTNYTISFRDEALGLGEVAECETYLRKLRE